MLEKLRNEEFDRVYQIMEASFPPDERRPREEQRALLEDPAYRIYVRRAPDAENIAAFAAVWEFEPVVFLEHFAVAPQYRNGGLGAKMLRELVDRAGKTVCLEVELPETELAARRIAFYERGGFCLNDYPYLQPPISEGRSAVPLRIMTSDGPIGAEEFRRVKALLYRRVYRQDETAAL